MNYHYNALEFPTMIEKLKEHALSEKARAKLDALAPYTSEAVCVRKMAETTSARKLLDSLGAPPLPMMKELEETVQLATAGSMLVPEQLNACAVFAESCKRMISYLARGESIDDTVALYGRSIESLSGMREEIDACISGDTVRDDASPALKGIRRKKEHLEGSIKEKLSHILQSRKQYLADGYITTRQGHYVLPVQRKFQSQFGGTVIEASGKGSTLFIEPSAISKLQGELTQLAIEEDAEVRRILYTLSALVAEWAAPLQHNMEAMELLDVLFAKAKLSAAMGAIPVATLGKQGQET